MAGTSTRKGIVQDDVTEKDRWCWGEERPGCQAFLVFIEWARSFFSIVPTLAVGSQYSSNFLVKTATWHLFVYLCLLVDYKLLSSSSPPWRLHVSLGPGTKLLLHWKLLSERISLHPPNTACVSTTNQPQHVIQGKQIQVWGEPWHSAPCKPTSKENDWKDMATTSAFPLP